MPSHLPSLWHGPISMETSATLTTTEGGKIALALNAIAVDNVGG
jgi:hypothetical protein